MEWNIQSRAHACHECGSAFEDKTHYHTVLVDRRRTFERKDLCDTCWKSIPAGKSRETQGFVSHWQGIYLASPPPPPEPIQKDTAESLLRRLIQENDPNRAGVIYILAVMLERKRILKVKSQILQEGRRIFVYEHPKSGDCFTIADPDLQLNQLEVVQRDVGMLLQSPPPPPPQSPSPSPSPAASEGSAGSSAATADGSEPAPDSQPATAAAAVVPAEASTVPPS